MSQLAQVLSDGAALRAEPRRERSERQAPAGLKGMISGASLVLAGSMVWQVSNFAFNAVGAHALGPARYGTLAASMALLSFVTPLLAAVQAVASREATSLVQRRELRILRPMLRHYGLRLAVGSVALGGAAALASGWISRLFHLGSPWLVVIVGAIIPCYMIGHLLGGLLQGVERFGRFATESVVEGLTKAVVGVLAMGFLWRSALAGLAAVAASSAVALVAYLLLTLPALAKGTLSPVTNEGLVVAVTRSRNSHRRSPRRGMPGVIGYSMTALCTYGLLALMISSDTLIAKHYLASHLAGLYAGVSLTGKIAYFAASSFVVVAFPVFSRHQDLGIGSTKWILAAGGIVAAIAGSIVALFALEPSWVVIPLLGSRYRGADRYVPWMAAVFGLYALGYLMSIYLLARKRRGVIVVLAAALVVQFAGFFGFHSTMTRLMGVLAAAFWVMIAGNIILILFGRGQETGTPGSGRVGAQPQRAAGSPVVLVPRPRARTPRPVPEQREAWRQQIVTEVVSHVGSAPVLLVGSRAVGTAHADSDYDVSVVLPLLRIPRAASRLARAAENLSATLGASVSVNAVPAFRMARPGGSLFVRKLGAEGVVLWAPPGWSLPRQPLTSVTEFAASSALLSAARSLLETFDTAAMRGASVPPQAGRALRKAALHVAQVRLLRSGCYASDLETALAQLRATPPCGSGERSGARLSAALSAGLTSVDPVDGFAAIRECILAKLAEISDAPFSLPIGRRLVRNAQYAAIAWLHGRRRWRVALSRGSVEAALATTQLALLRALDPGSPDGLDAAQLCLAEKALPALLGSVRTRSWEEMRDVVLCEWLDAHPLVGLLA